MKKIFVARPTTAAGMLALAFAVAYMGACVGDPPASVSPPPTEAGATPPGSEPVTPNDGGAGEGAPPATSFCATVPPAASAKETVFCEDFEGDYASRWSTSSGDGTMATTDVGGFKALDVTLNATTATDYTGPRLLWEKIPAGGTAEVSFSFMLLEAPAKPPSGGGLLWFGRIGTLGGVSIGFGAELSTTSVDYTAIINGGGGDLPTDAKLTFAPNDWIPVTIRYAATPTGSSQLVRVGTNPEYASTLNGDVALLQDDVVFLGIFVRGAPATARARFAKVVIRTTAP